MSERPAFSEAARQAAIIDDCRDLISAYRSGRLGDCELPEDSSPEFGEDQKETQLAYFTLPMSLNYRRNSSQLWNASLQTFEDNDTRDVFSIQASANMSVPVLGEKLAKYRVAMQPTRHVLNWRTISQTVASEWGSLTGLLEASNHDFVRLKQTVQQTHKKGFPYLAGPKLFNYWCYTLNSRCGIDLLNKDLIELAVDTHVTKCSVALGVISVEEATSLSTLEVASRWRETLTDTGIAPVELNEPLWFWSRNGFTYDIHAHKK